MIHFLVAVGIFRTASSQLSAPEPLYLRGCRGPRGQFAHESSCHRYYDCWDGRATIEECPGELLFNPVVSACDYPEAVNCGSRIRQPGPHVVGGRCLKRWGTFPDEADCSSFYECANYVAYRKRCGLYTAFDDRTLVCAHAHHVECRGRGGVYGTLAPPPLILFGHSPAISGGPLSGRTGVLDGSRSGQEKQYEKPVSEEATFRCPHPRGLYPSAVDCSRFWLCREFKPSLLKCPSGQLFDLASLSCTTPDKTQCSSISPRT